MNFRRVMMVFVNDVSDRFMLMMMVNLVGNVLKLEISRRFGGSS